MTEQGHVAMNFVADNDDVVFVTDMCQPSQRFSIPADACRIVRIAEDEQTAFLIHYTCQLLEVHGIASVRQLLERVHHNLFSVTFGCQSEGMINRRLYNHLLVLLEEYVDGHSYSFYDTRYEGKPLATYLPVMMLLDPLDDGYPQFVRHHRIAVK